MLEISGVVNSGSEQHDRVWLRKSRPGYCSAAISSKLLGIILHRQDRLAVEQLRERTLHHLLPIFRAHSLRHARRQAQIVFENINLPVAMCTHQVGARDVAPDALRQASEPAQGL